MDIKAFGGDFKNLKLTCHLLNNHLGYLSYENIITLLIHLDQNRPYFDKVCTKLILKLSSFALTLHKTYNNQAQSIISLINSLFWYAFVQPANWCVPQPSVIAKMFVNIYCIQVSIKKIKEEKDQQIINNELSNLPSIDEIG